jgi:hypothetical protein
MTKHGHTQNIRHLMNNLVVFEGFRVIWSKIIWSNDILLARTVKEVTCRSIDCRPNQLSTNQTLCQSNVG